MSDTVDIPRSAGMADTETAPGWWPAEDPFFTGPSAINLRCGGCKRHAGTMDNHTIAADGTVSPSILCGDCGWHVWGRLLGWPP